MLSPLMITKPYIGSLHSHNVNFHKIDTLSGIARLTVGSVQLIALFDCFIEYISEHSKHESRDRA